MNMADAARLQPQSLPPEAPFAEAPPLGVSAPSMPAPVEETWPVTRRVLYRFLFSYLVLYCIPNVGGPFPGFETALKWYTAFWHKVVPWVATHLFHASGQAVTYFPTGSGDTTLEYVQVFCLLVVSVAATVIWSILDRRRPNYRKANWYLRILVRYTLAFVMLLYGFAKIFPLQFRYLGFERLMEPLGDFSPMGVLWTFMGASPAYTIFTGAAESLGALLLFFRRTTTLGAMISAGCLLNIVLLNFCYDVPVKLYSTHLLLMAIFLLAPDLKRLANVFLFNRPVGAGEPGGPYLTRRWMRIVAVIVKTLLIASALALQTVQGWKAYQTQILKPERPPLFGLYEVESFIRGGQELPPLTTDASRWRKVAISRPRFLSVRMMNDTVRGFATQYDTAAGAITLTVGAEKGPKYTLRYSRPDADHVLLEGPFMNDAVSIRLRRIDTTKFQLTSRGFHWISEFPFNR